MTVVGIRPDFIRMSEVFRALDEHPGIEHILVHSGQHYDALLSDVFFKDLSIRQPDYNLKVGADGKQHYDQVSDLSKSLIDLCRDVGPDLIVYLGDSNSVLSAIPLKKEGYKICRIETGMRSGNLSLPEEVNRQCAEIVCDLFFAYTDINYFNLINEGKRHSSIRIVGNTIWQPLQKIISQLNLFDEPKKNSHILVDIHRHSNVTNATRMKNILDIANSMGEEYQKPVKMLTFNRTMKLIESNNIPTGNIEFIPLMGFIDFIKFQYDAVFSFSDSGTSVEECPILRTPVIVPRDETERPQAAMNQCGILIDVNSADLIENMRKVRDFLSPIPDMNFEWVKGENTAELIAANIFNFLLGK